MKRAPVFPTGTPVEWVGIIWEGNKMLAIVGPDLEEGLGGFGDTIPEALRDLANQMEKEGWKSTVLPADPGPGGKLQLVKPPRVSHHQKPEP